jgi:hypothetical protein
MDERTFWKTTPRKFFALLDAHNRANTYEETEEKTSNQKVEPATLEELMAWSKKR